MIPCSLRATCLAIASASLLCTTTARAQEGAPAGAPAAPLIRQAPPNMPLAAPTMRRVDASEPRKITGMVLTAIGIYHGFAGTVVLGTFAGIAGGDGLGIAYGLLFGGPLMGEGLILSCIGIPLWVSGAKTIEVVDEPAAAWVPDVDVGAGTAAATWHF
jgi:hypothetical protein